MTKHIINLLTLVAIWLLIVFGFGCKTRKVYLQTTHVTKEATKTSNTAVVSVDSTKSTNNTTKQETSHQEAKNTVQDSTELQADSIVITSKPNGEKKTTVYLKKGTTVKRVSNSDLNQTIDNTVNTAYNKSETNVKQLDSSVNKASHTKVDTTGKTKHSEAVGSGSVWAKGTLIVGGIIALVIVILVYLRFRK